MAMNSPETRMPLGIDTRSTAEVKIFSPKSKEALVGKGYVIYLLRKQSIVMMRTAGRRFYASLIGGDLPKDVLNLVSMQSEVAINPNRLFLPNTNFKIQEEQEEMLGRFSQELQRQIPGVCAILGEAPDYLDIVFQHLDITGEKLFGERQDFHYTRTKTRTVGRHGIIVGHHSEEGINITDWFSTSPGERLWAAPLIKPL